MPRQQSRSTVPSARRPAATPSRGVLAAVVAAAGLLLLLVSPAAAGWRVIAKSTAVVATHAVHLPRSYNMLVWGRPRYVSAPALVGGWCIGKGLAGWGP
jgi:hypothetical protein